MIRFLTKSIIGVIIFIKMLLIVAFLTSILAISYSQFRYYSSDFPEHIDLAKEKEGVAFGMSIYLLPIILSVVVDFKEVRNPKLNGKWYLLTLILILFYALNYKLRLSDTIGLLMATVISLVLVFIILWSGVFREALMKIKGMMSKRWK